MSLLSGVFLANYPGLSRSSIILGACTGHSTDQLLPDEDKSSIQVFYADLVSPKDPVDWVSPGLSHILNPSETSDPFWALETLFHKFLFSMNEMRHNYV